MDHFDDLDLVGPPESSVALHTITSLPLDPQFPLFRHYPAMKLGVRDSVRFFVRLLMPAVLEIFAREPDDMEWVVTSPPRFVMPAAATLLARAIHRELVARRGERPPRLAQLRCAAADPATPYLETTAAEYSRSSVAERVKNRREIHEARAAIALAEAELFRGRAVLFVNDINVTGTQQQFMRRTIAPAGPARICWLFVLDVDPALGRANPELEHALNHLHLASFDELAETVAGSDIEHTARCVNRLFRHAPSELEPVFRRMGARRATELLRIAAEEGAYKGAGADYQSRVALLARRMADFAAG